MSRKGVLPEIVDLFGSGEELQDETDESGIWNEAPKSTDSDENIDDTESNDDEDINSDDIDDLFG